MESYAVATVLLIAITAAVYWRADLRVPTDMRNRIVGWCGEFKVRFFLRMFFLRWPQWHDVYIPCPEKGLTQIDHLLITRRGIFVIETKNWRINLGRRPARQNERHVNAVASRLGLEPSGIESVIASVGTAKNAGAAQHVRSGLLSLIWYLMFANGKYIAKPRALADTICPHLFGGAHARRAHKESYEHDVFPTRFLEAVGYDLAEFQVRPSANDSATGLSFLGRHREGHREDSARGWLWSEAEEGAVRSLHEAGHSPQEIAHLNGRSAAAIEIKLGLREPRSEWASAQH